MARRWRAWHPGLPAEPGARVTLSADESHHVVRVLRLRVGESIGLFDGRGREWAGRLERCDSGGVDVVLEHEVEHPVEPGFDVSLFQGLCRNERMEWLLQKGTELGVRRFGVVTTQRAETRPPKPERLERWRRIVIEACKQSGRRRTPEIDTFDDLPAVPDEATLALLLDPSPGAPPLGRRLAADPPERVWLAVGPEGGFEQAESAAWQAAGWLPTALGPRILRTEGAGIVAAALVLHRWGDLGSIGPV